MAALKKSNNLKLFTVLTPRCFPQLTSRRTLKLQEFHSMDLFKRHQVTIQDFRVIDASMDVTPFSDFKADEYVVKAQILAGGRGKGHFDNGFKGGVHLTKNRDDVINLVKSMMGHKLITKQTPPEGVLVDKVLVTGRAIIKRETYFSIVMTGAYHGAAIVASPAGGMLIEEVAVKSPQLIKTISVDIHKGITDELGGQLADFLEFKEALKQQCVDNLKKLWQIFLEIDAVTLEVNPLAETDDGRVVAIDAKVVCDDNAGFRQVEIFSLDDTCKTKKDPKEILAAEHRLEYVDMDGSIGCMVNGAGLAMATMDIIVLHGGRPANFLDLGGGVGPKQVTVALKILESDPKVKSIFINVFGGVVDCVIIATGLIDACKKAPLKQPLIIRLEGNNSKNARTLLETCGLELNIMNNLDEAAKIAVKLAQLKA